MEDLVLICSLHKQPKDSLLPPRLRKGLIFYQQNTEIIQSNSLIYQTHHGKEQDWIKGRQTKTSRTIFLSYNCHKCHFSSSWTKQRLRSLLVNLSCPQLFLFYWTLLLLSTPLIILYGSPILFKQVTQSFSIEMDMLIFAQGQAYSHTRKSYDQIRWLNL